jgi:hypothetical protein
LESNDEDDWRIVWHLVQNILCNNANNLSVRIIKLRIMAKFEDWEDMREELDGRRQQPYHLSDLKRELKGGPSRV